MARWSCLCSFSNILYLSHCSLGLRNNNPMEGNFPVFNLIIGVIGLGIGPSP